jgi:hypothetical protein
MGEADGPTKDIKPAFLPPRSDTSASPTLHTDATLILLVRLRPPAQTPGTYR